jgi:hypothetical protein
MVVRSLKDSENLNECVKLYTVCEPGYVCEA